MPSVTTTATTKVEVCRYQGVQEMQFAEVAELIFVQKNITRDHGMVTVVAPEKRQVAEKSPVPGRKMEEDEAVK